MKLMEKGWTLPEIDSMDLCYYFRLLGHKSGEKSSGKTSVLKPVKDENGNQGLYIDQYGIF